MYGMASPRRCMDFSFDHSRIHRALDREGRSTAANVQAAMMRWWDWLAIKFADHRDDDLKERGERLMKELEKRRKKLARKPKANVVELKRKVKHERSDSKTA